MQFVVYYHRQFIYSGVCGLPIRKLQLFDEQIRKEITK